MHGANQRTVRGDAGLPKARGGSADGCGHAFASLGRWGGGGTLAGKRPPHKPRSDHNKTRQRPARPRCKRRRGDETPAPFCCPSTKEMDAEDRKSTRLNSSHSQISYSLFFFFKKKNK